MKVELKNHERSERENFLKVFQSNIIFCLIFAEFFVKFWKTCLFWGFWKFFAAHLESLCGTQFGKHWSRERQIEEEVDIMRMWDSD